MRTVGGMERERSVDCWVCLGRFLPVTDWCSSSCSCSCRWWVWFAGACRGHVALRLGPPCRGGRDAAQGQVSPALSDSNPFPHAWNRNPSSCSLKPDPDSKPYSRFLKPTVSSNCFAVVLCRACSARYWTRHAVCLARVVMSRRVEW
eukprot:1215773-Rhodomonas_salina.1